jgi:hypothetical protein
MRVCWAVPLKRLIGASMQFIVLTEPSNLFSVRNFIGGVSFGIHELL